MKKRWIIILGMLAAAAAVLILAKEADRSRQAAAAADQVVEINILMSTGGDILRKEYAQKRFDAYAAEHPGTVVNAAYVDSDTLAFLKLLYAGKGSGYDVVCMSDDAMLSAVEQKLICPLDQLLTERLGLNWLGSLPESSMVNTAAGGRIYGLPFIKSRLCVYTRDRAAGETGRPAAAGEREPVSLEQLAHNSGPDKRAAIPVDVLIRDLLLTAKSPGWDQMPEKYQVDTAEHREMLQAVKGQLVNGGIINGDYREILDAFCAGQAESAVLEEVYEEELARIAQFPYEKAELMRTGDIPWIGQGCNLYLTNLGAAHDYLPAWELMEYLTLGEKHAQRQDREQELAYKRVLSLKNTKVRLIVDRMIAEYLHGDRPTEELLENLQAQIEAVSEE